MRSTAFLALAATFTFALRTATAGDFNGDGFDDLAVGVLTEGTVLAPNAGAVQVFPGSLSGPSGAASIVLTGASFGFPEQPGQLFGAASEWGDFDGDGFDDLAIGATGTTVKGLNAAGRVFVVPGSAAGFDFTRAKSFDQNAKGIKEKVEPDAKGSSDSNETFGCALAVGDFDGNGFDDLAIGAAGERIGKQYGAGVIHVLYGGPKGLTAKKNQLWNQNSKGIKGVSAEDDGCGNALASGDVNGDGFDDLAFSTTEKAGAIKNSPRVVVLFGTKKGLSAKKNMLLEFAATPELGSELERPLIRLECGNFDGDLYDDLVIGSPQAPVVAGGSERGAVFVLRGSATGPITIAVTALTEGTGIVPGSDADDELFGAALVAADVDHDGRDDLAIGAPLDHVGSEAAGRITLLYGTAMGLSGVSATTFDQDTANIEGNANEGDLFGYAIAAGDFDGQGSADLAIGAPGDDVLAATDAGVVNILMSIPDFGITSANDLILYQDQPGTPDSSEASDRFGFTLGR